jgi:DNA-binding NtrC family response regulator
VGQAFAALGRAVLLLDGEWRVLYASAELDRLAGAGAAEAAEGRAAAELLGADLFGRRSPLRRALHRGERCERRSAELRRQGGEASPVELSVAPLGERFPEPELPARYLVVLAAAAEGDPAARAGLAAERLHLLAALAAHRWRREATASALGVSRTTLWRRMREAGLND